MKKLNEEELGACEICANCIERPNWFYCCNDNDNFGEISSPKDCDEFEYLEEDDEEEEDDESFNPNEPVECPKCGSDAYWNGSEYECSNDSCGWCGFPDDENDEEYEDDENDY